MAEGLRDVFIVGAARTPMGAFLGELSGLTAPELGAVAIEGALKRGNVPKEGVEQVILGNVLSAGIGQAPARQAVKKAGLGDNVGALTINKVCGSGMKAVMLAANEIRVGDADLIVAGGMESMSNAPYYLRGHRNGVKLGKQELVDGMIHDGLWDPYNDQHMGNCAEECAKKYNFSREAQDEYASESYRRAQAASNNGAFSAEIEPVSVPQRKGDPKIIDKDEEPFKGDPNKLSGLRPAFDKAGTITAGNASTLNDGAAALVLASAETVQRYSLSPIARIAASATFSQDPLWFTTAPIGAVNALLSKLSLAVYDINLYEVNEAFAAVAMAAQKDLEIPPERLNIHGGAIALGHPIGASGARLLVTLIHSLKATGKKRGLATLCIGGGEATAMVLEMMDS